MNKKNKDIDSLPQSNFFSVEFVSCMETALKKYQANKDNSLKKIVSFFFVARELCDYLEKDFLNITCEEAILYIKYLQLKKLSFNTIRNKIAKLKYLGKYIENECEPILPQKYQTVFTEDLFRSVMGEWVSTTLDKETLIGRIFGQLTVESYRMECGNDAICTCRCSCKKNCDVKESYLLNHYVTHCGDYSVHKKGVDLRSEKFGFLLVLERDRMVTTRKAKWLCLCGLCGRVVSVFADNLKSGNTVSCGCGQHYNREVLKEMLANPEKYCKYW